MRRIALLFLLAAVAAPAAQAATCYSSDTPPGVIQDGNCTGQRLQVNADGSINTKGVSSGSETANQGTANTNANAWPVKVIDGSGTNAGAVKAASTQPATTDTSFVVAISPNGNTGAASLAGFSANGAVLASAPGDWGVVHVPATVTQATATKSAGAAGVRHIATSVTATLCAGASSITAAAPLVVNLRDGASGAGTIVWSTIINVPIAAAQCTGVALSGLNVVGSTATAMTLEFNAAGGTNSYESVSLTGHDAN